MVDMILTIMYSQEDDKYNLLTHLLTKPLFWGIALTNKKPLKRMFKRFSLSGAYGT